MADVEVSTAGSIATLTLNRPRVLNALSPALLAELVERCGELATEQSAKVVVLRGAGASFCAGADLPKFIEQIESAPEETADLGRRAAEALASLPQVTIAAIRGHCVGGGVVIAGPCDLRVAAKSSRFSIPEVKAGIPLSWGGMADVVNLFGTAVANDLVLTCRPFDADEALRANFVSRVFADDDFDAEVAALAEQIAELPATVLEITKRKLQRIRAGTFDARQDAGEMLEALADEETKATNRAYMRKILGHRA